MRGTRSLVVKNQIWVLPKASESASTDSAIQPLSGIASSSRYSSACVMRAPWRCSGGSDAGSAGPGCAKRHSSRRITKNSMKKPFV
mgnify:CR=1 FL=1